MIWGEGGVVEVPVKEAFIIKVMKKRTSANKMQSPVGVCKYAQIGLMEEAAAAISLAVCAVNRNVCKAKITIIRAQTQLLLGGAL